MDFQDMNQSQQLYGTSYEYESIGRYTAKTFGWMFIGLMVTFAVAMAAYLTGAVWYVFAIPHAMLVLGIAEIGTVLFLSARITKVSVGTARGLFVFYSLLNGIVFSAYFLIFQLPSLVFVFGATSLFFGIMALVGYTTRADLSKLRNFLMGGLLFLLVFWLIGMFINLEAFEMMACTAGIFIFLLFTAYDTQKIKAYHQFYGHDEVMAKKASVFCALQLYLDFINLFLYLLRVLGKKK